MITGGPRGGILGLSPAFGMYTRLTGDGCHEPWVACTCTATSARAWLVNATCPSTPAVLRPVLRCLTCLEYPAPQPPYLLLMTPPVHLFPGITVEDRARALKSIHRSVQLIPWFWHLLLLRVKGSPAHVGTPFRAGHQARYPASYPPTIREELPVVQSAVSCCVSAAGIRFLDTLSCQTEFRPHYCRPTART